MPIYEYICEKCNAQFEVTQSITEDPITKHNGECGGKVRKLMSSNAFHLKGSGWYKTDYADKNTSDKDKSPPSEPTLSKSPPGEPPAKVSKDTAVPKAKEKVLDKDSPKPKASD
ncbi:MAG TPA: FmdB family zinc ribbon protein [Nitrospinota bacterium]|nr:FmdB family zinc ribbon protein [Nitrospinota bacterium]|tara:strand:+ start:266964 stop:267305 length:342 start_codon:yes stop_codon:yes gene_type:complete